MKLRIAAVALVLALVWACAHVEAPSGGPEDKDPPTLVVTRPDTLGVVPGWDAPAVLVFDERLSERGLQEAVLVSPRTSPVVVDHRGDEIRVRLRGGWQAGTIYHVTLMPGAQDLFGNRVVEPATLVFSTGPKIPETAVFGVVKDPLTGKPEAGIRVEAIRTADSLVYAIPTDTAGQYRIRRVPEGEYQVRAFRDLNRNRELDNFEPRGVTTATVTAGDSLQLALGVLMPDSTPPAITTAELRDSLTVELVFDDFLDPTQDIPPASVQILDPAGLLVGVESAAVGAPAGAASTGTPGAEPPSGDPRAGQADTATADPLPSQSLRIRLAPDGRLRPGTTYTVRVRNVRNVVGLSATVESELKVEAERPSPARPDSVAPADTARPGTPGRRRPGTPEP